MVGVPRSADMIGCFKYPYQSLIIKLTMCSLADKHIRQPTIYSCFEIVLLAYWASCLRAGAKLGQRRLMLAEPCPWACINAKWARLW